LGKFPKSLKFAKCLGIGEISKTPGNLENAWNLGNSRNSVENMRITYFSFEKMPRHL